MRRVPGRLPGQPSRRRSRADLLGCGTQAINAPLERLDCRSKSVFGSSCERFDTRELNLARYVKDGTVTDVDNGE
ncbi:hypothetical protein ABZY81_37630 [Streptomyces sp. NPDC006514]|uniref:hypothetical protein n=1 Tax=Streptomyces sp. NPDC006514 TaxID=3154308 RepID=UPI0033A7CE68